MYLFVDVLPRDLLSHVSRVVSRHTVLPPRAQRTATRRGSFCAVSARPMTLVSFSTRVSSSVSQFLSCFRARSDLSLTRLTRLTPSDLSLTPSDPVSPRQRFTSWRITWRSVTVDRWPTVCWGSSLTCRSAYRSQWRSRPTTWSTIGSVRHRV